MFSRVLRQQLASACLVVSCALALGGCAAAVAIGSKASSTVDADRVDVCADPRANDNSPVQVDIVIVFDSALAKKVVELPASDWFAKRDQFEKDFGDAMAVTSLEVVPGGKLTRKIGLMERYRAYAGLVFVGLPTPGDHRIRFDKLKRLRVSITAANFTYETSPASDATLCK